MKQALPATLRQLADFAEVRGASEEAAGWRRAATHVTRSGDAGAADLLELARRGGLADLPAVDPLLHRKLRVILIDGPEAVLHEVRRTLPWMIRRLLELAAIDSAGAATLVRHGIVTFADLDAALVDRRLTSELRGLLRRLETTAETLNEELPRVTLGRAVELADNLMRLLRAACRDAENVTAAGDLRRFEPLIRSLVIVASSSRPAAVIDALCAVPTLQGVPHRTERRALIGYQQAEVDVQVAARGEFGSVLFAATGSRAHVAAVRQRHDAPLVCAREEDVYARAGLAWIPPELRDDSGEIEAAAAGTLPALITRDEIRGDLHMHSTYSDGRDGLAEMVQACAALGYEYIAITDHSERAGAPRTVSLDALARQRDEIALLREGFPSLAILHGTEVDIMPDGRLDFPDWVLETLDIVLASLHDRAGHSGARLTRRYLSAIEHPLVNIITHPANRLVGYSDGYALDFPAIYAAAAETGTALEIDGAPAHLDMDGAHAREAVRAGVIVAIDSDCHRASLLDRQMRLGVGTARRGWVQAQHVLNTRSIAGIRAFVAAKRRLPR